MIDYIELVQQLYRNTPQMGGLPTGMPLILVFPLLNNCKTTSDLYRRMKHQIEEPGGFLKQESAKTQRLISVVHAACNLEGYKKVNLDKLYSAFIFMAHPLMLNELAVIRSDRKDNDKKSKVGKNCDFILKNAVLSGDERKALEAIKKRYTEVLQLNQFLETWTAYVLTQGGGDALTETEALVHSAVITKATKRQVPFRAALITYWYEVLNENGDTATQADVADIANLMLGSVIRKPITEKDVDYYRTRCPKIPPKKK